MATAYRASYSPRAEWFGTSGFPDQEPHDARAYAKRLVTYISDASTVRANTLAQFGKSPPKEMIRKWRAEYVAECEGRKRTRGEQVSYQDSDEIDAICTAIAERLVAGEYLEPGFSISHAPEFQGWCPEPQPEAVVLDPLEPGVTATRARPITFPDVIRDCAERLGITLEDVTGRSKKIPVVRARQLAAAVLRARGASYPVIGKRLGRDHSTMMYAVKACFRAMERDPQLRLAWMAAAPCAMKMARSNDELELMLQVRR